MSSAQKSLNLKQLTGAQLIDPISSSNFSPVGKQRYASLDAQNGPISANLNN